MADNRKVFYIYSKRLEKALDNVKNIKSRGAATHSLIKSYGLLEKCQIVEAAEASEQDLLSFHSTTYIQYLKSLQHVSDLEVAAERSETAEYNLEFDCPLFDYMYNFVKVVAGGTLSAVHFICSVQSREEKVEVCQNVKPRSYLKYCSRKRKTFEPPSNILTNNGNSIEQLSSSTGGGILKIYLKERKKTQNVSINWFGGWHHAQRDAAEGFCYINDIVIGIQNLLKFYQRVLYVDLDIHHGNGVENAFAHTQHVMTVSFHKYSAGYYPGTGSAQDVGIGPGKYYSVNVPLKDGITDTPYINLFCQVMNKIKEVYFPDCIVIQCGADSLTGDPLGGFNLSLHALGFCVDFLLKWNLPTTLLGGGGYNIANAARCYAYLTSIVTGVSIPSEIPENDFFHIYGPDFQLEITPSLRKNENPDWYLDLIRTDVMANLDHLRKT